ncbi:MAG: putative DNA-binding domain-containing protein [Proteobacteria bacterium]|nr:putative DNA-binding domain-containing protein [Pseudomonadota bacterium]MBS0573435.1 putative DNA-binding domain-containing protein [Pseudomonadota bacterium]
MTPQGQFRAALLDPDLPVPSGLTGPAGRPARRRFDIYRNNVTASLTEALRQSFPVVRALVGEEFFIALAIAHLRAYPPASPLLMFYGQDMPAFLESFPAARALGYLPDVARLELALRQSYHAADADALDPDRLRALAPETFLAARLRLAPAVRLLRSDWPVLSIWRANMRGAAPPRDRTAEDILITRTEFDPEPQLLPPGAASFLTALIGGATVGTALDHAGAFDLTATLSLLLADGAITDLITD